LRRVIGKDWRRLISIVTRGFFCEEDLTTYVGRGKTVPLLVTDMGKEAALRRLPGLRVRF